MSPEHRKRIETELEMLRRLLVEHEPLLRLASERAPTTWERSAAAALLHAFYNGIENVFKSVVHARGETIDRAGDWHSALLQRMTDTTGSPALLDADIADRLKEYLRFRHFFRHAYTFEIQWEKLEPLMSDLPAVAKRFEQQALSWLSSKAEPPSRL